MCVCLSEDGDKIPETVLHLIMQQENSCSLVALPNCLEKSMFELDTSVEMATIPQVPFDSCTR